MSFRKGRAIPLIGGRSPKNRVATAPGSDKRAVYWSVTTELGVSGETGVDVTGFSEMPGQNEPGVDFGVQSAERPEFGGLTSEMRTVKRSR